MTILLSQDGRAEAPYSISPRSLRHCKKQEGLQRFCLWLHRVTQWLSSSLRGSGRRGTIAGQTVLGPHKCLGRHPVGLNPSYKGSLTPNKVSVGLTSVPKDKPQQTVRVPQVSWVLAGLTPAEGAAGPHDPPICPTGPIHSGLWP